MSISTWRALFSLSYSSEELSAVSPVTSSFSRASSGPSTKRLVDRPSGLVVRAFLPGRERDISQLQSMAKQRSEPNCADKEDNVLSSVM